MKCVSLRSKKLRILSSLLDVKAMTYLAVYFPGIQNILKISKLCETCFLPSPVSLHLLRNKMLCETEHQLVLKFITKHLECRDYASYDTKLSFIVRHCIILRRFVQNVKKPASI